mgnify:CR=1 FL=1
MEDTAPLCKSLVASRLIRLNIRASHKHEPLSSHLLSDLGGQCWVTRGLNTLAHEAAMHNRCLLIRELASLGYPIATLNKQDRSPLHWAVYYNNSQAVEALLDCGHPIDACGKNGMTPLHLALVEGNTHMADLLIKRGASVFARVNETISCENIVDGLDLDENTIADLKKLIEEFTQHSFFSIVFD